MDYLFPEDRGSRLETRWGTFTRNNFTRNSTGRLIVKRLLVGPEGSPGSLDYSDWRLTQLPDLTPYRDVRYLNLERNDIDSLQPLHGRMPKMKHLNLGGNPVDLGPLASATSLSIISLTDTNVLTSDPNQITPIISD